MIVLAFLFGHWFLSLFFQTFFLHRYASHKMFTVNKGWERTFYFMTFIFQGSSFLNPRAYAILHRMHHAFSDTEHDPHSPHFFKDVFSMSWRTKNIFQDYLKYKRLPEKQFQGNYPEWKSLDDISNSVITRLIFILFYVWFYVIFVPEGHGWMFALLPIHILMGPLHGAIVNWCGHKYGYSNFDNKDHSKNTTPVDFLMLGELFQNNHHKFPNSPNFAKRWFEVDPVYPVMRFMHWAGIIKLRKVA